jgi:16S rRNA C967 or C1407 C5-methylase (RsmB/RsmF family)
MEDPVSGMRPHPDLTALERYRDVVPDWMAFSACIRTPLPMCAWLHPMRSAPEGFLEEDGFVLSPINWHPGGFRITRLPAVIDSLAYRAGLLHIQEEAAMLAVRMLAPEPGERVLDLCAAPGNKTAEIAIAMGGTGLVVANDRSGGRTNVLRTTADRLGLTNLAITIADGRRGPWKPESFDRVLADVPCSCDGTVRKHPSAVAATGPDARRRLTSVQGELLDAAVHACRPGGRIVYATCAFAPEENEGVVSSAIERFDGAIVATPIDIHGLHTRPGLDAFDGHSFLGELRHARRVWPGDMDAGGFFAVALEKTRSTAPESEAAELRPKEPDAQAEAIAQDVASWFGLSDTWIGTARFTGRGGKYVAAASTEAYTAGPGLGALCGIPVIRLNAVPPKPMTQFGLIAGRRATRQIVDVDRETAHRYCSRQDCMIEAGSAERGYVIVRTRGVPLGIGRLRRDGRSLESLHPRTWAGLTRPATP